MKLWKYICLIGFDKEHSFEEQRRIRLLAVLNAICAIVLSLYLILELIFGLHNFLPAVSCMFLFVFTDLILLHKKQYTAAKHFAIMSVSCSVTYIGMYSSNTHGEALFIPLITMPLIIFKNKNTSVFYFFLILIMLALVKIYQDDVIPLIDIHGSTLIFFKATNMVTAATVTYFITYYFKGANENYEERLKSMHDAVAEKNKEITDSIKYAKRIQESLMPTEKYIEKHLNNSVKK